MEGYCPNCDAEVPEGAVACPECGACEETGWSERARYDAIGVDYDEGEFDYDEFVKDEFGSERGFWTGRRVWVAIIAGLLVLLFLAGSF